MATPILIVRFARRGTVVWTPGQVRFSAQPGDRLEELRRAVEALLELEGVDLAYGAAVRDSLLTIGGARVVREQLGPTAGLPLPRARRGSDIAH